MALALRRAPGGPIPRTFVALPVPDGPGSPREALRSALPPPRPGVRVTEPDQLHITLHFLGDADRVQLIAALALVRSPPIPLDIEGVGQFRAVDGATTVWARVRPTDELAELQRAVADALAPTGFRPEARPYTPHISLARCAPDVAPGIVDGILAAAATLRHAGSEIRAFGLYSSAFVDRRPVYTEEERFAFTRGGPSAATRPEQA